MYKTGLILYRKPVLGMSAKAKPLPVSGHSDRFFVVVVGVYLLDTSESEEKKPNRTITKILKSFCFFR